MSTPTQKPAHSEDIVGQKDGHGPSPYLQDLEQEQPTLTATDRSTLLEFPECGFSPSLKHRQQVLHQRVNSH
ncbi:hypothetical protein CVT26_013467 [Gymnopilus dilepis]|uniref:Uncharacterized protein n=1 Tax=Gymnopilus dilepis TaxID=231916 RepID=A0A409YWY3_9AGAR|nr:hypothetical protein CVT26_013467 [Gymnopilus dilepis]